MNRNVENWLRAAIFVISGIGGTSITIWGLREFYKFSPEYFNFTACVDAISMLANCASERKGSVDDIFMVAGEGFNPCIPAV